MTSIPFKCSCIWNNIGEVVVCSYKIALSVYNSALFTGSDTVSPRRFYVRSLL